jgi:hypothetical protein
LEVEQRVIEEIREEIKNSWNLMKMKIQAIRTYRIQQRQSYEETL